MFNMKKIALIVLFFFLKVVSFATDSKGCSLFPENMKCEYLINPKGIDVVQPRLSWTLSALKTKEFGQRQTAYRILVASSESRLKDGIADLWDSKWVTSSDMQHIEYQGEALQSDRTYFWKVSVKDENGVASKWSAPTYWTTGLLNEDGWKATWMGTGELFDTKLPSNNISDPWLKKSFDLKFKPGKATIFVASVGYHELYVNGQRIGHDVLSPSVTDHSKRARYVAYDIHKELKPGKNVIALWLGTSWSIFGPYSSKDRPKTPIVIAQAKIYKENNPKSHTKPVLTIKTDKTWITHPSPNKLLGIWDSHHMGGDLWDANKEIGNWNLSSNDGKGWKEAVEYKPNLSLSAEMIEPNRLVHEIKPIEIISRPDGSFRVDMGVNFAGWTEINVSGEQGDKIEFLFSEREQDDITFGIRSAFIIGKGGKGTFRNRFNYSSGRWITIKGLQNKPELTDIKGWVVRTNYETATTFESSDSLQNWIHDRVNWTFENLSLGGYIVDCPQRERLGYGGDAHATSETGMFNYKMGAFYTKWMNDWRDVQGTESVVGNMHDTTFARKKVMSGRVFNNGILPHTAPTYMGGGGPAWGGIVVSLPWFVYQHEGDTRILEDNYQMIKNWLSFLDLHTKNDLLQRFGGPWDFLGDWLWPNATAEGMNNDKPETLALNNSYRIFNLRTAANIARVLGKTEDALKWEKQAAASSQAVHKRFYNDGDHSYADSSMSNLAAALLGNIPPPELREVVFARLEKEILEVQKGHVDVGITGGAMLFKVLRDAGRDDLIYSMTSKTAYPSWGFMKENDATTIWEMWEKDLPGHSLLHSSYLYPGAWYIDGVAGIRRDPDNPGFRRFIIRPPLLNETQISWAKASFESPAGLIESAWQRKNGDFSIQVTVPPNCVAELRLLKEDSRKIVEGSFVRKIGVEAGYDIFELSPGRHSL